MHRIESIRAKKRAGAQRAVLAFEGGSRGDLELAAEVAAEARLRKGDSLDEARIAELEALDRRFACAQKAWSLIALQPRTRRELEKALRQRKFAPQDIEAALEKVARAGHLDDAAYARQFVEQKAASAAQGPRLIAQQLKARGVSDEDLGASLAPAEDPARQRAAARAVLTKWLATSAAREPDPRKRARSAAGRLMRRGFDPEIVWEVVREGLEGADE